MEKLNREGFGVIYRAELEAMADAEVSRNATAVYCALCTIAGADNSCFPGITTLSRLSRIGDVRTLRKAINELEGAGFIRIEQRFGDNGGQRTNLYSLLFRIDTPECIKCPPPPGAEIAPPVIITQRGDAFLPPPSPETKCTPGGCTDCPPTISEYNDQNTKISEKYVYDLAVRIREILNQSCTAKRSKGRVKRVDSFSVGELLEAGATEQDIVQVARAEMPVNWYELDKAVRAAKGLQQHHGRVRWWE